MFYLVNSSFQVLGKCEHAEDAHRRASQLNSFNESQDLAPKEDLMSIFIDRDYSNYAIPEQHSLTGSCSVMVFSKEEIDRKAGFEVHESHLESILPDLGINPIRLTAAAGNIIA